MSHHIKILEMGAEGDSISLYQFIDSTKKKWFYHSVSEIAREDLDMEGVDKF